MPFIIPPDSPTTGPESDPDLPPDFDPDLHPIIAEHWFGLDLCEVRQVFWNQAHLGHRLPAQKGVIVIEGVGDGL